MCDKPLGVHLAEAIALREIVRQTGRVFALTHNYTGYPMVKQARALVRNGELGEIRKVVTEYAQGWLATRSKRKAKSRPSGGPTLSEPEPPAASETSERTRKTSAATSPVSRSKSSALISQLLSRDVVSRTTPACSCVTRAAPKVSCTPRKSAPARKTRLESRFTARRLPSNGSRSRLTS